MPNLKLKFFACALAISLTGTIACAKGPANKITGDFVRLNDSNQLTTYECEISAHEAKDNRAQKGSMYCVRADNPDNYWEIDLSAKNSCVYVGLQGTGQVGGMVTSAGTDADHLIGKFVAFNIFDGGEPGYLTDSSEHAIYNDLGDFQTWCSTGEFGEGVKFYSYTVQEGNLQVHLYGE